MSDDGSTRLGDLYLQMCRMRYVEQALARLWHAGMVSGEMHLGIGEEGVVAGVVGALEPGDALALDYRSTPPLVARGVPVAPLLLEMLGSPAGLCAGRAGHMHLMSPEHLAAASGIVGAPGPLACGFGLAASRLAEGRVAVALFGDGAVNEGMLMEALNLAAAWHLPVVFVCKDNRWAVSTRSSELTGGGLRRRLAAFGLPVAVVDGADVLAVDRQARRLVARARAGRGASVLLARCTRMEGHFVGDPMARLNVAVEQSRPLVEQLRAQPGAPMTERFAALTSIVRRNVSASLGRSSRRRDPLRVAERRFSRPAAKEIAEQARAEIEQALEATRAAVGAHA
ncbi:MAG TPA: thiamine pyrophosphate-dependent enzyme [Mycobacteriales bacterium]|nr:thiamine pyrophosphate-dependent enzyme [Mycobacteriales bacterium]